MNRRFQFGTAVFRLKDSAVRKARRIAAPWLPAGPSDGPERSRERPPLLPSRHTKKAGSAALRGISRSRASGLFFLKQRSGAMSTPGKKQSFVL